MFRHPARNTVKEKHQTTKCHGDTLPLYIVSLIASLTDNKWLDALKYLTPYTFSDPLVVLKNGYTFEVVNFLTFTVLAIISFFIAYRTFVKKNLPIEKINQKTGCFYLKVCKTRQKA